MSADVLRIEPKQKRILYADGEELQPGWPTVRSPENLRDWARDMRPHAKLIVVEEK